MRFSAGLSTERVAYGSELVGADALRDTARCVEQAGFDAAFVTDHPFPPDEWLNAGGHHALDPFVALSFAAAQTSKLRLHTNILVLPYRNPFLTAKAIATLDFLSGGRTIVGVAAGYLEGEFEALGADFATRNSTTDAYLTAMKRAWTESAVCCEGPGFRAAGNTMLPAPIQQPHPPLWVGGNSKRAIRRAVEMADGWIPFINPPALAAHTQSAVLSSLADLRDKVAYARELASRTQRGRSLDICFSLSSFGKSSASDQQVLDTVGELANAGVTWLTVTIRGHSRSEYMDSAARFGASIISRV